MELLGAALPNVMFIVGILALGLGLGIELKVVSLNKEIDKTGRIGAFIAGIVLIGASLVLYLNPSSTAHDQTKQSDSVAAVAAAATPAAPTSEAPTQAPPTPLPPTSEPPTQAPPTPSSTPAATPTPSPVPATAVPTVLVPNLHGKDDKTVRDTLSKAGLKPLKADSCSGPDAAEEKPRKNRVQCQNPPAGQGVAVGGTVEYVLGR